MVTKKNEDTLDKILIKIVQEKKPTNVQQLIDLTKLETTFIPEQKIMQHIMQLKKQGKITLKEAAIRIPLKLSTYLKTTEAIWFWIIIILVTATTLSVFTVQENAYPLMYIRYVLGSIFVLFLPGYSLVKALFPEKELSNIERAALSMALSIVLVPLTALILNYTPWGIRTTPMTLSLLVLTIILATAAIMREHQNKLKQQHI